MLPSRLSSFSAMLPDRRTSEAAHGRFWMAVGAIFFGAMAVVTRSVSHELGAGQIAFIRFALGLLGVIGVAAWRPALFRATRPVGLALRGLFGGGAVLGYFTAIQHLSAGLGTLLNYIFPLWSSIFAAIFLGELLTWWVGLGLVLATTGLVVVVGPSQLQLVLHGMGDRTVQVGLLAGLASSLSGGAATTVVRWLRRTESALAVFGAFCLFGMFVCLPPALRDWRPVSAHAAWLLLVIAALSFGGQMLFTYALKFVTAGAGALTTQLTVVASYGFAALFLGEAIRLSTLLGGALVLTGILVVSRSSHSPAADGSDLSGAAPDLD